MLRPASVKNFDGAGRPYFLSASVNNYQNSNSFTLIDLMNKATPEEKYYALKLDGHVVLLGLLLETLAGITAQYFTGSNPAPESLERDIKHPKKD